MTPRKSLAFRVTSAVHTLKRFAFALVRKVPPVGLEPTLDGF